MDIKEYEEDFQRFSDYDKRKDALIADICNLTCKYRNTDKFAEKEAYKSLCSTRQIIMDEIGRALSLIDDLKFQCEGKEEGEVKYFKLIDGKIVKYMNEVRYITLINLLAIHSNDIAKNIEDPLLKERFIAFCKFINDNKKTLKSIKESNWRSTGPAEPVVELNPPRKIFYSTYSSNLRVLKVARISCVINNHPNINLKLEGEYGKEEAVNFYTELVEQLEPELKILFEARQKIRNENSVIGNTLHEFVSKNFAPWLAIEGI